MNTALEVRCHATRRLGHCPFTSGKKDRGIPAIAHDSDNAETFMQRSR